MNRNIQYHVHCDGADVSQFSLIVPLHHEIGSTQTLGVI